MDLQPLLLSLRVALAATLIAGLVGIGLATLLARRRFPGRDLLDVAVTLPMIMPPTVLGYYVLVVVGRPSAIGRAFEGLFGSPIVFTTTGAVLAATIGALPLVVRSTRAALEGVAPSLLDAARTLRAGPTRVFLTVQLPLAARGIVAGLMLGFARSLGDFGVTLMVAGDIPGETQTASLAIFDAIQANRERDAAGMIAILSAVAVAVLYAVLKLTAAPRDGRARVAAVPAETPTGPLAGPGERSALVGSGEQSVSAASGEPSVSAASGEPSVSVAPGGPSVSATAIARVPDGAAPAPAPGELVPAPRPPGSPPAATLEVQARVTRYAASGFTLDVELTAPPGMTLLAGPSGSGKSTTLAAIAGLVRPDAGRIALGRTPWFGPRTETPASRREVGLVFQALSLFPHLTGLGNVAYGIRRDLPRRERRQRALAMLERMQAMHLAGRRPATFSGGEAQRVALARALAMEPRVLLLDEAFTGLDARLRAELAAKVRRFVSEAGIPAIWVTHRADEVMAPGDRLLVIEDGRLAETAPALVTAVD